MPSSTRMARPYFINMHCSFGDVACEQQRDTNDFPVCIHFVHFFIEVIEAFTDQSVENIGYA